MKKFTKKDTNAYNITFRGIEYAFLIEKEDIGIRRIDQESPTWLEVQKLTEYIISEGWADHLLDKEDMY